MTEQIYYGNLVSFFLILLEQFWINGMWAGWGQLANHFKNNDYFTDYCDSKTTDTNGTTKYEDCDRRYNLKIVLRYFFENLKNYRDELFNNIYTIAGIIYGAGSFFFGILSDRIGIVLSRIASLLFACTGLTLLVLVLNRQIDEVTGMWCAWPLIAIGGLGNHISNIRERVDCMT